MTINTNTFESNLTTKINATSGTTDAKEFLLLGKAIEAVTPSVVVQDVIDQGDTEIARVTAEGNTQVANVQAAGSSYLTTTAASTTYAPLAGATFTGGITGTTATFSGDLAAVGGTYSGNLSAVDLVLSGNLTVNGTQTVINSATMTVDDLNITVADGAADAAAANGAGLTVDGANATIIYTSSSDTWDFNKAITGTYTDLHPVVNSQTTINGASTFDVNKPMHHYTMTGAATFTGVGIAAGKTSMMVLDTSATPHTPTWNANIKWPDATEPTWADYRYWIVSFTCLNGTTILASASGYTV
jgi:hypothetical protein